MTIKYRIKSWLALDHRMATEPGGMRVDPNRDRGRTRRSGYEIVEEQVGWRIAENLRRMALRRNEALRIAAARQAEADAAETARKRSARARQKTKQQIEARREAKRAAAELIADGG